MVDRITAPELAERLDDGRSLTLVDTRQPDSFEAWHIHGAENVPFGPTEEFDDDHLDQVEELADGDPVVAICGKGLTSTPFGIHLEEAGYDDVEVVRGGMEAWSTVHEVVDVTGEPGADAREADPTSGDTEKGTVDDDLLVRQVQRRATGCLGYVVGSWSAGEALVVDPTRQTDEYVTAAEEVGLTITGVVDTHVHADHLSGAPDLAHELGVPYRLGVEVEDPEVDHDFETLGDGQVLAVGDLELRVLHTPGHTGEMATLVVDDRYLLTADTLHLDSVGRTELAFGEDDAEHGAELLYESLHDTLLELDDDVTVLPGHVSVTDDTRFDVGEPGEPLRARLGDLRGDVDLLGLDRESFVERLTDDLPEKPDEYETVIAVNAGEESVETEEDAAELETGPNSCSA